VSILIGARASGAESAPKSITTTANLSPIIGKEKSVAGNSFPNFHPFVHIAGRIENWGKSCLPPMISPEYLLQKRSL
jgi:hypothetical protein